MWKSALNDHSIAIAQAAVARRAVDIEPLPPAFKQRQSDWRRRWRVQRLVASHRIRDGLLRPARLRAVWQLIRIELRLIGHVITGGQDERQAEDRNACLRFHARTSSMRSAPRRSNVSCTEIASKCGSLASTQMRNRSREAR